jgi:predicted dehydrogenase
MTLKVGIISANWGAVAHLPAWRAVPGVEVVGICTSRKETADAAAQRHNIPRPFWDAEAMAADPDIDILDCGTRPNIREAMVLAALRHGKHVYNSIPFAASLDGARALRDAWQASGTIGTVDAYSEWLPAHALAREMIDGGYLGQLFGGTCHFNISLFNKPDPRFPYNWFAKAGLGVSAVRNLGSHALHMLTFLFGEVEELVAHDSQLLNEWHFTDGSTIAAETNDFANAILRFRNGLVMQFQISWNAPVPEGWSIDVFGSAGRLALRAPSFPTTRDTTLHAGKLASGPMEPVAMPDRLMYAPEVTLDCTAPMPPSYPMALSMNRMVRAIEGGGPARPDFAQGWQVERLQEAIRRSSAERRWVRIDEIM